MRYIIATLALLPLLDTPALAGGFRPATVRATRDYYSFNRKPHHYRYYRMHKRYDHIHYPSYLIYREYPGTYYRDEYHQHRSINAYSTYRHDDFRSYYRGLSTYYRR